MSKLFDFFSKKVIFRLNRSLSISGTHSIKQFFWRYLKISLIFFVAIFIGISFHYSSIVRNQVYQSMSSTMALHNTQITQNFHDIMAFLSENCSRNADVTSLSATTDKAEIAFLTVKIQKLLSLSNISSDISGMFIYSQPQDIFIPKINESQAQSYQSNYQSSLSIIKMLREHNQNHTLDSLNLNDWFHFSNQSNHYLLRIIKRQNTYAGAWMNLNLLSSAFPSFKDMDVSIFYVDRDGVPLGNTAFSDARFSLTDFLEKTSFYTDHNKKRYLAVAQELDYSDYYIMALIPAHHIFRQFSSVYWLFLLLLIWLFFFCFFIVTVTHSFFDAPNQILQPIIKSMRQKEFSQTITCDNHFIEIQNITETFNEMISEIQNLRINIYEEQLKKKDLELQCLKTQVAPHFLINCLNIIFVLAQDRSSITISEQIIQTLSEHLRYTLATRTSVKLSEELYYVENYLKLCQLRFPGCLEYHIQSDISVAESEVFPLLILMLTENSVKSNIVMGELLTISITVNSYIQNGQKRIHITHIDSGTGIDEQKLELYNTITEHPETIQHGHGIGIYNIAMRLKLLFGPNSRLLFSNESNSGARVDIDFCYITEMEGLK